MKLKRPKVRSRRKAGALPQMGAPITKGGMRMGRGMSMTSTPLANPAPDIMAPLRRGRR